MGYYHWKPSKAAIRDFKEKMDAIDSFCKDHNIEQSSSSDSYYFTINGQDYRVSNHTIEASNKHAYSTIGFETIQTRPLYHPNGREADTIYITASKTRLIEIYTNLEKGLKLDKRGFVVSK